MGVAAVVVTVLAFVTSGSARDPVLAGIVWVGLGTVALLGMVWPIVALWGVRIDVRTAVSDGRVGGVIPAEALVSTRVPVPHVEVSVAGDEPRRWSPGAGPEPLPLPSRRRTVLRSLPVEVVVDGPVGFLRARRRVVVELASDVYIGPDPLTASRRRETADDSDVDDVGRALVGHSDVVRSVRPYRVGDPAHLVHWPSSARVGALVVRELEPPTVDALVIVVRLTSPAGVDDPAEEMAVARAAGVALDALELGAAVWMCTCVDGAPVTARVSSPVGVNRRLAAAGPGTPGEPPAAARRWPVVEFGR